MARIQLRPCENEFKQDADFIEIPIDDGRYMKIYRTYGVYETTKGNYKRAEQVHVKVMRKQSDYHDCNSWETESSTSYDVDLEQGE